MQDPSDRVAPDPEVSGAGTDELAEPSEPKADRSDEDLEDRPQIEPAEPSAEEDAGEQTLEELIAERDQFRELALRSRADFENYQKRVSRDLQTERTYAPQPFIIDLLPVLDNLDRALESAQGQSESEGLIEGIQIVRKQILEVFSKHGASPIQPAADETFDPNQHEAVLQQPTSEKPPMTVLQTFRIGYKFHDRVIRPAQVVVASEPPGEEQKKDDDEPAEES